MHNEIIPKSKLLTFRQHQIINLLAKGHYYKEIALQLTITEGTLKQHINKMYIRLKCNNKVEAINIWKATLIDDKED